MAFLMEILNWIEQRLLMKSIDDGEIFVNKIFQDMEATQKIDNGGLQDIFNSDVFSEEGDPWMIEPNTNRNNSDHKAVLDYALEYHRRGFNLLPNKYRTKVPIIKWEEFQTRRQTEEEIRELFRQKRINIGIVCGTISNLLIIDIDGKDWEDTKRITNNLFAAFPFLQNTQMVLTGSGFKIHLWCLCKCIPEDLTILIREFPNGSRVELRGNGAQGIAPPSVHESGGEYSFIKEEIPGTELNAEQLASITKWFGVQKATEDKAQDEGAEKTQDEDCWNEGIFEEITEGGRNTFLTRLAGRYIQKGLSEEEILSFLIGFNEKKCKPPLDKKELLKIFKSILKTHTRKKGERGAPSSKPSQAEKIISLFDAECFHDQYNDGLAFIDKECIPLRSKKVRHYLSKLLWEAEGKAASSEALSQALNVIEAKSIFSKPQIYLSNRVAKQTNGENTFYYDLGKGKVVKIAPHGWEVCDATILFRRYSHQREQVIPVKGGDPWLLFKYLNVKKEDQLLILCYLISCFIPDFPHPVFHPFGDHGSGKTTFCLLIKSLIDPSAIMTLPIPEDRKEAVQILNHHWAPIFDNVSWISDAMSDLLSQASTGGGFQKRMLYSDDEDIIYSFRRCIGLNGINISVQKPDLMDRTILIGLQRISTDKRKEEKLLWAEFEKDRPYILGGIFDTMSKAMAIYPQVQLPWTPRMADFGKWGFAIAEALTKAGGEEFLKAYQRNIHRQNEELISTNTLAQAVLNFMHDLNSWNGSLGEAYECLKKAANDPDKKDPTFPKSARGLRGHLNRIKPNLQDCGITFVLGQRERGGYPITFTYKRMESNVHNVHNVHEPNENEGLYDEQEVHEVTF